MHLSQMKNKIGAEAKLQLESWDALMTFQCFVPLLHQLPALMSVFVWLNRNLKWQNRPYDPLVSK